MSPRSAWSLKPPTFRQISEAELKWIESQFTAGIHFARLYAPPFGGLRLEVLDAAWSAWIGTSPIDTDDIGHAINCVGIAFGSLLVETGEFQWCIASDAWGTDLAVRALPGRGDVAVFPIDFMSKRWETRTVDFLADAFPQIMDHVAGVRGDWNTDRP